MGRARVVWVLQKEETSERMKNYRCGTEPPDTGRAGSTPGRDRTGTAKAIRF